MTVPDKPISDGSYTDLVRRHGPSCPWCKALAPLWHPLSNRWQCEGCGATWVDRYRLAGYDPCEEPGA